jgi:hypothetical protein
MTDQDVEVEKEAKIFDALNTDITDLRRSLEACDLLLGGVVSSTDTLRPYMEQEGGAVRENVTRDFGNLATNAHRIHDSLSAAMKDYSFTWQAEIDHQEKIRVSERNDRWKDWLQRYVRWAGGIIVAVVIYSGLVWIGDNCGFIKIPLIDVFKSMVS